MSQNSPPIPEVGQAVQVRNRLGTVRAVEYHDGDNGRFHLVDVDYLDDFRFPESDQLLWEVESRPKVLGKTSLPDVGAYPPDEPAALQAFVNTHRWTRLNRLRASDRIDEEPILGVWNSAIQVHAYQLEPVLKALEMPRVSLLLADGVGLGKTIQAGLVLEELLLRRRIRRVLVLCPAMLQRQWQIELRRKFNLDFKLIDSDSAFRIRREMGIDTNPWKAFPRIITSMDYLRMDDVQGQFLQASGVGPDADLDPRQASPHAPWDLLIVDEAHHFAPQGGSWASKRTKLLREIRFLFEHRIFCSATPHNGKTVCFTGLLELLDPIRFQMWNEMDDAARANLDQVRIRRLKEDINRQSLYPPFAEQNDPVSLPVKLSPKEVALYDALRAYRRRGQQELEKAGGRERWLGQFIFSMLTKRLLSCPYAFARTWWRHIGDEEHPEQDGDLFQMARLTAEKAEGETRSDEEKSTLEEDAARFTGAWFRSRGQEHGELVQGVSTALDQLGYGRQAVQDEGKRPTLAARPGVDAKTEELVGWIKKNLFQAGTLRDDERLIVFTEYKETLFFLRDRLLTEGFDDNTLRMLYGGMGPAEFDAVKEEFEDRDSGVRLLLATDAASEGINMQESCRWVMHYDIPWSPSRLQQRNGRVSRHGQERDVSVYYFRSDQDEDMQFLHYVAQKVEQVRRDLGSVERVFEAAIQRHFAGQSVPVEKLNELVQRRLGESREKADLGLTQEDELARRHSQARQMLENTDSRLGISPAALLDVLRTALTVEGKGKLDPAEGRAGFYRLSPPPRWKTLADQTLGVGRGGDRPEIVFDSSRVERTLPGKQVRVLKLKKHQVLMRLGHPVMRQALATLSRQLYARTDPGINRWSVAAMQKGGFEALMVFHYTVTAINQLREPLHDEVCSAVFRVEGDGLSPASDELTRDVLRGTLLPIRSDARRDGLVRTLRARWGRHRSLLEAFVSQKADELKGVFEGHAKAALARDKAAAEEAYRYRLTELKDRSREQDLRKLAKELRAIQAEAEEMPLFAGMVQAETSEREEDIEQQIALLQKDVAATRERIEAERDKRLKQLLPKRFTLQKDQLRVLPLAVVYLVPADAEDLPS